MILSICMMVKNEEACIENCLKSIESIRKNISSELVIVDTGSTDRTVEIVSKYTDQVYHHPWNNNFSEMRNTSISYAKGEWILILDADEVFETYEKILDFFCSNLHQKYNSASLIVRNFLKKNDLSQYTDLHALRFFRNEKTFKYEGVIHNIPVYREPTFFIDSKLFHFGYVNDDPVLMKRKYERTSKLLLQEIEKTPDNIYYWYQLSITEAMNKNWEKALEAIEFASNLLKGITNSQKNNFFYVYNQRLIVLKHFAKFQEMIALEKECISIRKDDIDSRFLLADAFLNLNDYEKSKEHYSKALNLIGLYEKGKLKVYFDTKMETIAFKEHIIKALVFLSYQLKDYSDVITYYQKCTDVSIKSNLEFYYIKALLYNGDFDLFNSVYYKISPNSKIEILDDFAQSISRKDCKYLEKGFETKIKNSDFSLIYQILNCKTDDLDLDKVSQLPYPIVLKYFLGNIIESNDFSCFISVLEMNYSEIERYISFFDIQTIEWLKANLSNYEMFNLSVDQLATCNQLFYFLLKESVLTPDFEVFKIYIDVSYALYKLVYLDEIVNYEENWSLILEDEVRFILHTHAALTYELAGAVKHLKSALKLGKQYHEYLQILIEILKSK